MSNFRQRETDLANATGRRAREVRGMVQRRVVSELRADGTATVLGREDEAGNFEQSETTVAKQPGLVARPPANDYVEAIVVYVGAAGDHPVAVAQFDAGARVVIENAGLEADETLLYTSGAMVKITAAGEIWIGAHVGSFESLAFKSDADALNTRISQLESALNALVSTFNAHVHAGVTTGAGSSLTTPTQAAAADTTATVAGTSRLKAQ